MGRKISETLFCMVAALFSAVLLVLSLLCAIDLAAVNDKAAELEKETGRLKTENQVLLAQIENSISLEELERIALEKLGMQRPTPEQIKFIDILEQVD